MSIEEIKHFNLIFDKLNGINNAEQIILKQKPQIILNDNCNCNLVLKNDENDSSIMVNVENDGLALKNDENDGLVLKNDENDGSVMVNDENIKKIIPDKDINEQLVETCDKHIFHDIEKNDNNKNNTIYIDDKLNDRINFQPTTINQSLINFNDTHFNKNNYSNDSTKIINENELEKSSGDKQELVVHPTNVSKCNQTDKIIHVKNLKLETMNNLVENRESTNEIELSITDVHSNQIQRIANDNEIKNRDLTQSVGIAFRIVPIKEKQVITRTKVSNLTKFWKDRMIKNLNKI